MHYPLVEKIGPPELLVGRVEEFTRFNKWLAGIPRRISKSRVILARRKSGKTAFVQRLFNQLWSQNGQVIPFYLDIADEDIWYPAFARNYFRHFASQYIAFLERDEQPVRLPFSLDEIRAYGVSKGVALLVSHVDDLRREEENGYHDLMWEVAKSAPHRFAAVYDQRFLVILDEFQNIASYVYPDPEYASKPMATMPGSFHSLSESKIAPMLVTGSYIGLLQKIMDEYLEAGRLSISRFQPYLTREEGLEAVYRYAEVYAEPITNQTAQQINELCMADPFFISCVIQSEFADRELTTTDGVINTVNFEISDRQSEMSKTWAEYLRLTFQRVNGTTTKNLMLFLNKHDDRYWTPRELKGQLNLDLTEEEIYQRLVLLAESDVILRGVSDIRFRGLQDGTLNLILRHRFEEQIEGFEPDLRSEFQATLAALEANKKSLQGRVNYLEGVLAEHLLATELRAKKHVRLSAYFHGIADDRALNLLEVQLRVPFQRADGKSEEIDLLGKAADGRVLMVEVRKRQEKTNVKAVTDLRDNALAYAEQMGVTVLPAFLSLGGFTEEAKTFCAAHGIGIADQIAYAA
jgi:hypothetical protein